VGKITPDLPRKVDTSSKTKLPNWHNSKGTSSAAQRFGAAALLLCGAAITLAPAAVVPPAYFQTFHAQSFEKRSQDESSNLP
jgi:hypothetical protein